MHTTTVIIGAGHAGLSMSRRLTERSLDHVVIERGEVANSWRTERWNSLRLLTPNWQNRLPGMGPAAGDPDVKDKLLAGHEAGDGKTFKTHLDGYNLLPFLNGDVDESPRHRSSWSRPSASAYADASAPAAARSDGERSIELTTPSHARPPVIPPAGQRTRNGTRMPPSQSVYFVPRSGVLSA